MLQIISALFVTSLLAVGGIAKAPAPKAVSNCCTGCSCDKPCCDGACTCEDCASCCGGCCK